MSTRGSRPDDDRWQARPILSRVLVLAAHSLPLGAAVAASSVASRSMSEPRGLGQTAMRLAILLAISTSVLLVVDRLARRVLPLAALLRLAMVFPDQAPSRLAVARKSGSVKDLRRAVENAQALGHDSELTHAASVILSLVSALHAHDRHTRGHSERVRWFTDLLADELRLPQADRDRLRWASLLHDIGKLHVHSKILNKPSKLDDREWRAIHRHPEAGARLAAPLIPWLGPWAATIEQHHERWDGTGYPKGLSGSEISLGARIVGVADAYEVMTAARPYKKALTAAAARKELTSCAGTHFDPAIVRAFLNISVGRLRWVTGPVAWIAQIPFIGWVPRVAESASVVTTSAANVATAVGVAAFSVGLVPPAAPEATTDAPAAADGGTAPVTPTSTPAVRRSTSTRAATSGVQTNTAIATTTTVPVPGRAVEHSNAERSATSAHQEEPAPAQEAPGRTTVASTRTPERTTADRPTSAPTVTFPDLRKDKPVKDQ